MPVPVYTSNEMRRGFVWCVLLGVLAPLFVRGQTRRINGFVKDKLTGETIANASVSYSNQAGVQTNTYGFYSLRVPQSQGKLTVTCVGYQKSTFDLRPSRNDTTFTLIVLPGSQELENVTVTAKRDEDRHLSPLTGRFQISTELVKKTPALLGENDVLKTLQLLPGVQAGAEGTANFNVRGGTPDQNLILLDGVPVYNVNHLFGFFSIFNTDALSNIEFYKGSLPARYGGRLSSVIDISMKEGNTNEQKGLFALSPIAGRFILEGPVKQGKSSSMIAARRTWLDAFITPIQKLTNSEQFVSYNFYDLNAKINFTPTAKDRIFVSTYLGNDRFTNNTVSDDVNYNYRFAWGNQTGTIRWNRVVNSKLFSNLTAYYANYQYGLTTRYFAENNNFFSRAASGIRDWALRLDMDYLPNSAHSVKFGISAIRHAFSPEIQQLRTNTGVTDTTFRSGSVLRALEASAYVEDDITWGKLKVNAGLHFASFWVEGRAYPSVQPRLAGRYLLSDRSSIKASYARTVQYIHLLTNSSLGLPTDLWVPSTGKLSPQAATQYSIGYARLLSRLGFDFSLDVYYKSMSNQLEYREGSTFLSDYDTDWQRKVTVGRGESYGAEMMLEKKQGRTRGWLSYTLSWNNRLFADLNQGKPFPYRYDRRHNIALLLTHTLSKTKSLSANFILSSGNAVTLPSSVYKGVMPSFQTQIGKFDYIQQSFNELGDISQRNNYRTPFYHRMDISYKTSKMRGDNVRSWVFSIYNLYNRRNPFYLYYEKNQLKQFSLFPVVPSITYQYEF